MLTSFQSSTTALRPNTHNQYKITDRERQVLHLIAYEHTAKEIAAKLFVSYETVNSHRKNIMSKLDVKNTAGMVRVAFERQLLSVPQSS